MANQSVDLFGINVPIRLVDNQDGSYSIATKLVTAGYVMAGTDIAASIFGVNKPILLVKLASGDYALAIATAVTPKPASDISVSLFGINTPIRLVALSGNVYALATAAQ